MVLINYKVIGRYRGFCYEEIVNDLELEDTFKRVTGESIDEYEHDSTKISENRLIHKILDEAETEYLLYSDVVGRNEEMYYSVLKVNK